MQAEAIELRAMRMWLGDDGIVRAIVGPGAQVSRADAVEAVATTNRLTGGRKAPLIVDCRGIAYMDREARSYYAGEEARATVHCVGLLVASPVSRVLGSFFLGLNRPPMPTRLFTSEGRAVEWLKGFVG